MMLLRARQHRIEFPRKPMVMGIVNINDDSFCGDGSLNRGPISTDEEVARLRPFIETFPAIKKATGKTSAMLSVNTWRTEVVRQVLPLGVDLLNDMGALPTPDNASLCAKHGSALLIMHSIGQPKQAHRGQHYTDVVAEVESFFLAKLKAVETAGLDRACTVLDPGIDFAKDREDNLQLMRELDRLTELGRPILLPVSRKTVIGEVLDLENPLERDPGTVACSVAGIMQGVAILRVHNVAATVSAVQVIDPIINNRKSLT